MKNRYDIYKLFFIGVLITGLFFACKKSDSVLPTDDGQDTERPDSTKNPMDSTLVQTWPDTSRIDQARKFPGVVGENVHRITDSTITLDLDYNNVSKNLRIQTTPRPLFSTGLYAPIGEKIKIELPAGLEGLSVQIGAWTDDLYGEEAQNRSPLIYVRKKLKAGENIIWNLYGGTIYILAEKPISGTVDLTVSGAVKSPDFVLGETNAAHWYNEVQNTDVPWLELRNENMILTVPRKLVINRNLNDPTDLLNAWNDGIKKDFYEWTGLEENPSDDINQLPGLPYRAVLDTQVLGDLSYHGGSPAMFENTPDNIDALLDQNKVTDGEVWNTYGAFGSNNLQTSIWTWDDILSSAGNIFGVHAIHRLGKKWKDLNDAFPSEVAEAMDYISQSGSKDFSDESFSSIFKLVPFIQIFEKAQPAAGNGDDGYDFIPFLYKAAREVDTLSANNQEKRDFFYLTLADFIQKDPRLFFSSWGISISSKARKKLQNEGYDLLTKTIWTYDPVQDTGGTSEYNPYNNASWTVVDFSSVSGAGSESNVIDGDINTTWQGDWHQHLPPPHYITIDMGLPLEVGSFYFVQSQGNRGTIGIRFIQVEVSNDGVNWDYLDTYFLENIGDKQTFRLDTKQTFRYFKLTIPDSESLYGGTDVGLAEVGVNKDFAGIDPYQPVSGDPYDQENWDIWAISSQQSSGEGQYHGLASNILDGNKDSYWHARYYPNATEPPQWIIVDFHQDLDVYGLDFMQRQGGARNIKNLTVFVSKDLQQWDSLDTYELEKENGLQTFWLPQKENFRYVKLKVNSKDDLYDPPFPCLAEFTVRSEPYDPYDNTIWSATANSEQPADPVSLLIDGDKGTYWHNNWGAGEKPPFEITVDMKKELQVSSFNFIQRQDNAGVRPNRIEILYSNDDANWTSLGFFNLSISDVNTQTVDLSNPETFRYFKIIIHDKDDIGNSFNDAALAEVSVNKD